MNGKGNIVQKCVLVPVEKYKKMIQKQVELLTLTPPTTIQSASALSTAAPSAAPLRWNLSQILSMYIELFNRKPTIQTFLD